MIINVRRLKDEECRGMGPKSNYEIMENVDGTEIGDITYGIMAGWLKWRRESGVLL